MLNWIVPFIVCSIVSLVFFCIGYGTGYDGGYDTADFLKSDNIEQSGRVLFILKECDADTVILSNGERIIIYEREREI